VTPTTKKQEQRHQRPGIDHRTIKHSGQTPHPAHRHREQLPARQRAQPQAMEQAPPFIWVHNKNMSADDNLSQAFLRKLTKLFGE
jgi:hypothetical protein